MAKEQKPRSAFDELGQTLLAIRLAGRCPGPLPHRVGKLKLYSTSIDPAVPGRIRYSYRDPADVSAGSQRGRAG